MLFVFLVLLPGILHCTLIQYKSGTIISQEGVISAGSTNMHLIVQIPQIVNATDYAYPRPCNYGFYLQTDLIRRNMTTQNTPGDPRMKQMSTFNRTVEKFNQICKRFAQIKRLNSHLKRAYEEKIFNGYRAIELLTNQDNRRQKRSLFSALRYAFNVGSYDTQQKLRNTVNDLDRAIITTNGELIGLKFVISHQAEKIKHLQESATQVTQVLRTISNYDNVLAEAINANSMLQYYKDNMLFDLISAGLITNEILQEYSNVVKDQMHAINLLNRRFLPPTLITPQDLRVILSKMVQSLENTYPFIRLTYDNIYTYYSINNVHSFVKDNNYYIEIPVLLKMYDQEFTLYNLQNVHIPMPNQPDYLMTLKHSPMIAVNKDSGTYVTLNKDWRSELDCVGYQDIYCKNIITEQYQNGGRNCELSIVQNKTNHIMENCKIAMIEQQNVLPKVHIIKENKVLLENPQNSKVYKKCLGGSQKEFVSSKQLIEVTVPCFCSLYSEKFITTVVTSDSCVSTPDIKLYNPMDNIIFLRMLLNDTLSDTHNISMDAIPRLNLPDLIEDFDIQDDNSLLNLKDVLAANKQNFYNLASNRITRTEETVKHYSLFRLCAMLSPILAIIVLGLILFVCIRNKKLGQLISLLSLSKTTNAAPLSDDSDLSGFYDIFASICTLVLLLLWLTYLILRYYKFFQRIKRTATLPFTECVTATKPPSWKIVIYISNFNNYCYLYIDSVLHYPESVVTSSPTTQLSLTYHANICNSYVTLNNQDLTLLTKYESFVLPVAVSVPMLLKHTVKSILSTDYKVESMIGSGSHFKVLPIGTITPNPLPAPQTESIQ